MIKNTKKKEFKHFGKDLSEMKHYLLKLKNRRQDDKKKLQNETETAVKEVEDFRKLIDWVLDRMERKGKEYIEKRYKELNKAITEEIIRCEEMIISLEKVKSLWKSRGKQMSLDHYVNIKKGKQTMKKAQILCDSMKSHASREMVKFTVDPKVENFARNLAWFGKDRTYLSFEQPLSFPHLYQIKHDNQFDIKARGDKRVCSIIDICQLQDGTLLVIDAANRRVKQLDVLCQLVDSCDVPGDPVAVCDVCHGMAAVAIDIGTGTVVQYIEVKNDLNMGDSFTIPTQCTSLACSIDTLYVSTGNSICTYTTAGDLIQQIYSGMSVGRTVLTQDSGKILFITGDGKLFSLNKSGEMLAEIDIENTLVNSIAADRNGQIFISVFDSHSVIQYNHDLQELGVVVGPRTGVRNPQAIAFDRIHNRLVVAMKFKNIIKVFELK